MKLILLILLACVPIQAQHKVESKYDHFTNKTTVRIRFLRVFQAHMRTIMVDGSYQYKGEGNRIQPPDVVWLDFYSTGDDRFSDKTKLYVLFDDERAEFQREFPNTGYAIPFNQFEKILNSNKIEMRLGGVELSLTDEIITALKDFIPKPL